MNYLKALTRALQYPQSALSGVIGAQKLVGTDASSDDIVAQVMKGLKGGYRPSEALGLSEGNDIASKAGSTAADVLVDPLMLLGAFGKAGKLGKLGEGAATYGKLGEDATLGMKGAQWGRRLYEGVKATGGDPLMSLGYAAGTGFTESKLLPAIARRFPDLLTKTADELVDEASNVKTAEKIAELIPSAPETQLNLEPLIAEAMNQKNVLRLSPEDFKRLLDKREKGMVMPTVSGNPWRPGKRYV